MVILGIGGILDDAATALLAGGRIVAAAEEKKIARYVRAGRLPRESIGACLKSGGTDPANVDYVALVRPTGDRPETALHLELRSLFPNARIVLVDHHTAHACSAFHTSGFEEATVLTLDREGDLRCGARWRGQGPRLELDRELYFPDSFGDLYSRVTALLGYTPNADEHKVQWLSVSGDGRFTPLFEEVLCCQAGWPRMERSVFDSNQFAGGGFSAAFLKKLGLESGAVPPGLRPHIAAGIQRATENAVQAMAGAGGNLALAGGLAFNALLIARLEQDGRFPNVYVQPAAGNSGTALGAVLYVWHSIEHRTERVSFPHLFLGPAFSPEEIKQVLENCKLRFRYLLTAGELISRAVEELSENRIIAWMQGAMEFGPRALGNRSILASPLNPYSTENLNLYIKHREPSRKFAASVPEELAPEYFDSGPNARFLATVGRVKPAHRKTFEPAILAGDLVRVHAVRRQDSPLYWELLHAAGKSTGLPVLFNTSFNLFGDPLVCSPRDAVRSFYSSGIDTLFAGNFIVQK